MRGLFNFIISTDSPYNNTTELGLIVNTEITERDAQFVNRIGVVEAIPEVGENLGIDVGDEIIVHHNVFRVHYDLQRNLSLGANYIDEGLYHVSEDQIFAYRRKEGSWRALPGYCFVSPIRNEEEWRISDEVENKGVLTYASDGTDKLGVSIGDTVGFTSNSEYEFVIEKQRLYRVYSHDINVLYYGYEKRTTEDNKVLQESFTGTG